MGAKLKSRTHLQNIVFWFFAPFFAHLASKFAKSANMIPKIFCGKKSRNTYIKNAEFHADFESVEKVVKKYTKKSYKQNKFDKHE